MNDTLVVVCGLKAEAKIAAGTGITVIAGGGDGPPLEAALRAAAPTARAFVSFGIAGGLDPALRPGAVLVARAVLTLDGLSHDTDAAWSQRLARVLGTRLDLFLGVDEPVASIAEKRARRGAGGAAVVDMESHIVARAAADSRLPFVAIRVVADPAERQLPHAATVGMRRDGGVDIPAVLGSLRRDPRQIPALIRAARDANAAFASLLRCRPLLGGRFGLVDLGDPLLDMA